MIGTAFNAVWQSTQLINAVCLFRAGIAVVAVYVISELICGLKFLLDCVYLLLAVVFKLDKSSILF